MKVYIVISTFNSLELTNDIEIEVVYDSKEKAINKINSLTKKYLNNQIYDYGFYIDKEYNLSIDYKSKLPTFIHLSNKDFPDKCYMEFEIIERTIE